MGQGINSCGIDLALKFSSCFKLTIGVYLRSVPEAGIKGMDTDTVGCNYLSRHRCLRLAQHFPLFDSINPKHHLIVFFFQVHLCRSQANKINRNGAFHIGTLLIITLGSTAIFDFLFQITNYL